MSFVRVGGTVRGYKSAMTVKLYLTTSLPWSCTLCDRTELADLVPRYVTHQRISARTEFTYLVGVATV